MARVDRLQGMLVFVKVVESGSFASASADLDMSPQMVGRHVQAIERRLGVTLLNRTTRHHSLSEAGRIYYERCKAVLAEADHADRSLQELTGRVRGLLRVNAPVTYGTYRLMPVISRYLQAHPEVEVDLTLSNRVINAIEDGYDAVIRIGPIADSTLVVRALAPYGLMLCAAPSYVAKRGCPEEPSELAAHDCLDFAFSAYQPTPVWQFMGDNGLQAVQVSSRFRVNDSRAQLAAALDGLGIMLGAEMMLACEVARGRLVELMPTFKPVARPVHLLMPGGRRMTPKLRMFVDEVAASLAG